MLSLTPGRPVSTDALIDRLWGEWPPRNARHSLYTHVSAVRRIFGSHGNECEPAQLRRAGGGYVLDIDHDQVDLHRARRLVEEARALPDGEGREAESVQLLREACALWGDAPLAGLSSDWADRARVGLMQEGVSVHVERFTLELRLGEHAAIIGPLAALLEEHPLVEPVAGLHMLALYRCGLQADALAVYAQTRKRLVDELGDEPGAELRQLHQQILRRDPKLGLDRVVRAAI